MAQDKERGEASKAAGKFLGSLREALAAAGRDDTGRGSSAATASADDRSDGAGGGRKPTPAPELGANDSEAGQPKDGMSPPAAEAVREARGGTPNIPPLKPDADRHIEFEAPPTTKVVRATPPAAAGVIASPAGAPRTQLIRGKQTMKRGQFHQDPVVGWLVVVGGLGLGSFRPVFEGNNSVGRSITQRVPIDFGDDTISAEEQAYIRYDSADRSFLFVPNLAKTNVVSVNDKRPTTAVALSAMDVITMGRTQLVFVPFCGAEFDWAELTEQKD